MVTFGTITTGEGARDLFKRIESGQESSVISTPEGARTQFSRVIRRRRGSSRRRRAAARRRAQLEAAKSQFAKVEAGAPSVAVTQAQAQTQAESIGIKRTPTTFDRTRQFQNQRRLQSLISEERARRKAFVDVIGQEEGGLAESIFPKTSRRFKSEIGGEALLAQRRAEFGQQFFATTRRKQFESQLKTQRSSAQAQLERQADVLQSQLNKGSITLGQAQGIAEVERGLAQQQLNLAANELSAQFKKDTEDFGETFIGEESARFQKKLEPRTGGLGGRFGFDVALQRNIPGIRPALSGLTKFSQNLDKSIAKEQRASVKFAKQTAQSFADIGAGIIRRPATTLAVAGTAGIITLTGGLAAPAITASALKGSLVAKTLLVGGGVAKVGLPALFVGGTTIRLATAPTGREMSRRFGESLALAGAAMGGAKAGGGSAARLLARRPAKISATATRRMLKGGDVDLRIRGSVKRFGLIRGKPQESVRFFRKTTISTRGYRTKDITETGFLKFRPPFSRKPIIQRIDLRGEAVPSFVRELGTGREGVQAFVGLKGFVGKQPIRTEFTAFEKEISGKFLGEFGIGKTFDAKLSKFRMPKKGILKFKIIENIKPAKSLFPKLGKKAQVDIIPRTRGEPLIPKFGAGISRAPSRVGTGVKTKIVQLPLTGFADILSVGLPVSKSLLIPGLFSKVRTGALPKLGVDSLLQAGSLTSAGFDTGTGVTPSTISGGQIVSGGVSGFDLGLGIGIPAFTGGLFVPPGFLLPRLPSLPGGRFGGFRRRGKKPKRKVRVFTPDIRSLIEGRFAKRKPKGVLTGLERRPIVLKELRKLGF